MTTQDLGHLLNSGDVLWDVLTTLAPYGLKTLTVHVYGEPIAITYVMWSSHNAREAALNFFCE